MSNQFYNNTGRSGLGRNHFYNTDTRQDSSVSSNDLLREIMSTASPYVHPREDKVPSGLYFSEIVDVKPRIKAGYGNRADKLMLDVSYDIEGYDYKNKGQTYKILQSYPVGSPYIQDFFKAMDRAGVDYRADPKNVIGTVERIKLSYTSDRSDIGSIVARAPYIEEDEDETETDSVEESSEYEED